jgi:hypothetical protein
MDGATRDSSPLTGLSEFVYRHAYVGRGRVETRRKAGSHPI